MEPEMWKQCTCLGKMTVFKNEEDLFTHHSAKTLDKKHHVVGKTGVRELSGAIRTLDGTSRQLQKV